MSMRLPPSVRFSLLKLGLTLGGIAFVVMAIFLQGSIRWWCVVAAVACLIARLILMFIGNRPTVDKITRPARDVSAAEINFRRFVIIYSSVFGGIAAVLLVLSLVFGGPFQIPAQVAAAVLAAIAAAILLLLPTGLRRIREMSDPTNSREGS